jgi:hypothetical protein
MKDIGDKNTSLIDTIKYRVVLRSVLSFIAPFLLYTIAWMVLSII